MNTSDLKQALEQLGEAVSDTAVFRMISDVDPNNTGQMSFYAFKELVTTKREEAKGTSDADLLDAYVAMGGD
jgi:calmodulin